jgi:hypothetical protein
MCFAVLLFENILTSLPHAGSLFVRAVQSLRPELQEEIRSRAQAVVLAQIDRVQETVEALVEVLLL